MTRAATIATALSLRSVVSRHDGITTKAAARKLHVRIAAVRLDAAKARDMGILIEAGTLVPLPYSGAWTTPALLDLYGWCCDVGGTAEDYAEATGKNLLTVLGMVQRARTARMLAPAYGLWTTRRYNELRDECWEIASSASVTRAVRPDVGGRTMTQREHVRRMLLAEPSITNAEIVIRTGYPITSVRRCRSWACVGRERRIRETGRDARLAAK